LKEQLEDSSPSSYGLLHGTIIGICFIGASQFGGFSLLHETTICNNRIEFLEDPLPLPTGALFH
jgi:hypothetical protein